jgi:putative phosphoribosyl transferase
MELNRSDRFGINRIFDLPQYRNRTRVFQSRREAADAMARLLPSWFIYSNPVLLAVSARGYALATSLARRFELDVDYAPVQNVCLPWDSETDYAAVAFDGTVYLDSDMVNHNRLGQREIDKGVARVLETMRSEAIPVNSASLRNLRTRNVLLIDDGVTTGAVVRAAIKMLKCYCVTIPSLAVTTAHDRALSKLSPLVKYIFCVNIRSGYSYVVDDAYKQSVGSRAGDDAGLSNGIRLDSLSA